MFHAILFFNIRMFTAKEPKTNIKFLKLKLIQQN